MRVRAWAAVIPLALLAALGVAALALAQPKEVVFLGFGGTHEKNLREHAIPAFEKQSGIKVIYVAGTMAANFARAQAQKGRPDADVLWNNDLMIDFENVCLSPAPPSSSSTKMGRSGRCSYPSYRPN